MRKLNILGIIPARGGSKGVPRKNIRLLSGKPLIAYTITAALASRHISKLILSTEDQEIAEVGRTFGAEVPFIRPAGLAEDCTPTLPVLQHAVEWYEPLYGRLDGVCLLQATTPFRPTAWIDGCIAKFVNKDADTVVTVLPVPSKYNPHWVYFDNSDGGITLSNGGRDPIVRRQSLPQAWHREGSVYVISREVLIEQGSLYGNRVVPYRVQPSRSLNIDTMDDWHEAEREFKRRNG